MLADWTWERGYEMVGTLSASPSVLPGAECTMSGACCSLCWHWWDSAGLPASATILAAQKGDRIEPQSATSFTWSIVLHIHSQASYTPRWILNRNVGILVLFQISFTLCRDLRILINQGLKWKKMHLSRILFCPRRWIIFSKRKLIPNPTDE